MVSAVKESRVHWHPGGVVAMKIQVLERSLQNTLNYNREIMLIILCNSVQVKGRGNVSNVTRLLQPGSRVGRVRFDMVIQCMLLVNARHPMQLPHQLIYLLYSVTVTFLSSPRRQWGFSPIDRQTDRPYDHWIVCLCRTFGNCDIYDVDHCRCCCC